MNARDERVRCLYAHLYKHCIVVLVSLCLAWGFVFASLQWSERTGADWFSRSGSVLALVGAVGTFRLVGRLQTALAVALHEGLAPVSREIEISLSPPRLFHIASYCSYLTGALGTLIWGYGDKLVPLLAAAS